MTPTEAMEIVQSKTLRGISTSDLNAACATLATEYRKEHDPRPLTLELAKEVLGEPDKVDEGERWAATWGSGTDDYWCLCDYGILTLIRHDRWYRPPHLTVGLLRTLKRLP